ncbi:MAG TPA: c-type cytochrome [Terriglobales bacterium]|nr:c-type cytochrome [Terriglobales bacterium]
MVERTWLILLSAIILSLCGSAFAAEKDVEQGKYITLEIAKCGTCHTPVNEKGEPIREKWMQGAKIPFKPIGKVTEWADWAPSLSGMRRWPEAVSIRLLMTGMGADGVTPPRPPMPRYHMNTADATAVLHYLRTLPPTE